MNYRHTSITVIAYLHGLETKANICVNFIDGI